MKVNFTCPACSDRFLAECREKYPDGGYFNDIELPQELVFELTEDRFYTDRCKIGHDVKFILPQQKFEILFDLGTCAIHDGYTREAVLSFAASLERYYEFATKVLLAKQEVTADKIAEMWKTISVQSERQLGAYVSLYTSEFKKKPNIMDQNYTKTRNDVAHKGAIPSISQAIDFGDYVISIIRPSTEEMQKHCPQIVRRVLLEQTQAVAPNELQPHEYSTLTIGTILKAEPTEDPQSARPLAEQLADVHHRWSDWGKVKRG